MEKRKLRILNEYDVVYNEIESGKLTSIPIVKRGKQDSKLTFVGSKPNWGLRTGKLRNDGTQGDLAYRNSVEKMLDNGFVSLQYIDNYQGSVRKIIGGNCSDIVNVLRYLISRVDGADDNSRISAELEMSNECTEGNSSQVVVNRYERDSNARNRCVEANGCYCHICGLNFEEFYGDLGRDFIHVHHLVPLHTIGQEYSFNPIVDLVPVCPNCHAMLHRYLRRHDLQTREEYAKAVNDLAQSIKKK